MKAKRQKHAGAFKAKVAIEANSGKRDFLLIRGLQYQYLLTCGLKEGSS